MSIISIGAQTCISPGMDSTARLPQELVESGGLLLIPEIPPIPLKMLQSDVTQAIHTP